jgi:hypothetical protein
MRRINRNRLVAAVIVRPSAPGLSIEVQGRLAQLTETPGIPSLGCLYGIGGSGGPLPTLAEQ